MRRTMISMLVAATFLFLTGLAQAQQPDATLELSGGSFAAGLGFSWGSGVLTFQGAKYPFKVSGLSVGEVGITRANATGNVYDLKKLEDFNGTYTAAAAGATVGGGAGAFTMKNQNGVVINLVSTTQGLNFKVSVDGMKLTLTK